MRRIEAARGSEWAVALTGLGRAEQPWSGKIQLNDVAAYVASASSPLRRG